MHLKKKNKDGRKEKIIRKFARKLLALNLVVKLFQLSFSRKVTFYRYNAFSKLSVNQFHNFL